VVVVVVQAGSLGSQVVVHSGNEGLTQHNSKSGQQGALGYRQQKSLG